MTRSAIWGGWTLFFCGICMGAADLVPGISGGTIAFILGFYQPLLDSLKSLNSTAFGYLLKGKFRLFTEQIAWKFILTLLAGIIFSFISLTSFLHHILAHEIYRIYLYSTFLGLILASFVFCMRQIKIWNAKITLGLVGGVLAAYFLTESTLTPAEGDLAVPIQLESSVIALRNYDASHHLLTGLSKQTLAVLLSQGILQDHTPVYNQQRVLIGLVGELVVPYKLAFFNGWLVFCGALAVCALLLPGISGSYILTLLGVYPLVIEAFVDFIQGMKSFSFNSEAFAILWSLGIGILIGALAFARTISWLLKKHPNQILAILSGFMIGAIRSVWPFWSYEYVMIPLKLYKGPQLVTLHPYIPSLDSPFIWQASLCCLTGFLFVFALENYMQKKVQQA